MKLDKADQRTLTLWAADCAWHVLPCFEEKYPDDDRPRDAIEAARAWARAEIAMGEARAAAVSTDAHAATASELKWQYRRLPEHLRPVAFLAPGSA
jgi:hypothetical protein